MGTCDDAGQMRTRVTDKLHTLAPALEPTLPAVLALFDVPVDDRTWQVLDPSQRRQRTLDALKCLLLRESQVQPVLLVCENLHWIDSETQAFLESLPTARLLLVNYRPEHHHPWRRKTYYTQLRLDPLPSTSAGGLLTALLGDDHTIEPLQRVLIERTEGNPFFLVLLAEAHGTLGQPEAGITVLTEALTLVDATGGRWYAPELYRLKGALLLQQSSDNQVEAETCFQQAISIARSQQAKSFE